MDDLQPVLVTPVTQEFPTVVNGQAINDFLLKLHTLDRCQRSLPMWCDFLE